MSLSQTRWPILQARACPGVTLKARARLGLKKVGPTPPLGQPHKSISHWLDVCTSLTTFSRFSGDVFKQMRDPRVSAFAGLARSLI